MHRGACCTCNHHGMTLVELMVSIAVTMVVATLSISIFTSQYKSHLKLSDSHELQESIPPVVETIKRELMEAGWAVLPQMAFYFVDGGVNGSDEVFINDVNIIQVSMNNATELPRANDLLKDPDNALCASIINAGDQVTIEPDYGFRSLEDRQTCTNPLDTDGDCIIDFPNVTSDDTRRFYLITDSLTKKVGRITETQANGSQATFSLDREVAGTLAAPAIHYCVDDGNNAACDPDGTAATWILWRSDRNTEGPFAENVVDLQVAYRDQDGVTWYGAAGCTAPCAPASFNPAEIDLIRCTLITRVGHQNPALKNNPKYCRPAAENRAAAAVGSNECGYTYRTFTFLLRPRNT